MPTRSAHGIRGNERINKVNNEMAERVAKIKAGLAKGKCAECTEKCKSRGRCQCFSPTHEFMEKVRKEVCGD